MFDEFNLKLNELITSTRERLKVRAEFYARAGITNLSAVGRRAEGILLHWLETKTKALEERAEQTFWSMNRPIGWLNKVLDQFERKTHQSEQAQESREDEEKLQDLELSRMAGEGGGTVEPPAEDETLSEKSA